MKKKIDVQELVLGMYVSELDRPWVGTPFLFQGFEVRTQEELQQLKNLCAHVYIDTDPPAVAGNPRPAARPFVVVDNKEGPREVSAPTLDILKTFAAGQHHGSRYQDTVSLEQEMPRAREVVANTRALVYEIMNDVRLGRAFDAPKAKEAVAGMVGSIIRNPDALVCLTQLKKRDEYTALHSLRVAILALAFGRHLDFSEDELNLLGIGALLHDIGKIKVPPEILNKPGRLTPEEFDLVKKHVPWGVEILESHPGIPKAAIEVARSHHERYSGGGYIYGLQGDNIGLFGSIGAIVDCYDAITSDRAYHDGVSAYDALATLYAARRKDYHPELVEQFIQCMGIFPIGALVELSTGSVGVVVSVNRQRRLRPRVALVLTSDKQPFAGFKIVDLTDAINEELEIKRVLPAGSHGINPVDYLPLTV